MVLILELVVVPAFSAISHSEQVLGSSDAFVSTYNGRAKKPGCRSLDFRYQEKGMSLIAILLFNSWYCDDLIEALLRKSSSTAPYERQKSKKGRWISDSIRSCELKQIGYSLRKAMSSSCIILSV